LPVGTPAAAPMAIPLGPARASAAGSEGLATQLLARLVERLDAPSSPPPPPPEPGNKRATWPWVAAGFALVAVIAGIAIAVVLKPHPPVQTNVVVRLEGIGAVNDPTVVSFRLDNKPISKEELAGSLTLSPGSHVLEVKRKDDSVQKIPFEVG